MRIDLWYGDSEEAIAGADSYFYPQLNCTYRGNLYDANGNIIGDYVAQDSLEVANRFPGIFDDTAAEEEKQ